ncbi:MAG TPA: hypothetical protein PKL31_14705 [Fulvivirga sp.]|nr:hypothetical protein [Fulvivirga sp.]
MNTRIKRVIYLGLFSLIMACQESPIPVDPCNDGQWATALKNGTEVCFPEISVTYFFPNTKNAVIIFDAGQLLMDEINAEFSIPVEGIELNKDYPLKEGKISGADPFTEGKINFILFDMPGQSKSGCIAGTFSLKANSPNAPASFEFTEGKFVYFRSAMSQENRDSGTGCNPF